MLAPERVGEDAREGVRDGTRDLLGVAGAVVCAIVSNVEEDSEEAGCTHDGDELIVGVILDGIADVARWRGGAEGDYCEL